MKLGADDKELRPSRSFSSFSCLLRFRFRFLDFLFFLDFLCELGLLSELEFLSRLLRFFLDFFREVAGLGSGLLDVLSRLRAELLLSRLTGLESSFRTRLGLLSGLGLVLLNRLGLVLLSLSELRLLRRSGLGLLSRLGLGLLSRLELEL